MLQINIPIKLYIGVNQESYNKAILQKGLNVCCLCQSK